MEIVFNNAQNHQQQAIQNIMEIISPCMNNGSVEINKLATSLQEFYKSPNGINVPIKNINEHNNIDVLMETGTGKTYTYLEMIFELNKRFGCEKFIIFLPRTSILESVKQNIKLTAKHFTSIYGKQISIYEKTNNRSNKKNNNIISNGYFKNKGEISVLLLMAQSIKNEKNLLNQSNERFFGLFNDNGINSVLAHIAALKPICILDEPHLLSGEAFLSKFMKSKNEKAEFKDCLLVRFGATFKKASVDKKGNKKNDILELSNVAYVLDSKMAFQNYLVKQISVNYQENIIKNKHNETNNIVSENLDINRTNIDKNQISTMLEIAINRHFEKEEKLFKQNIKALSLFFIENIADFKGENAFVRTEFEKLYKAKRQQIINNKNISAEYKAYLENDFDENNNLKVLGGYFSGDGKTADESEKIAVDLILKDKLKLLSLNEPLRFLFSVWALQEGWDNPNIFTLTKLSKTNSEISARQQVGRGLRLCVNNQGSRITKEFCNGDDIKFYDINCLDVVVGADESNFIANLQKEINANSFILDVESKITEEYLCNILNIKNKQARKILDLLDDYKIIDENNIIQKPINEALETSEFANKINTILKENNGIDIEKFKNAFISNSNNKHTQIKLAKENDEVGIKTNLAQEFKELWQTINKTVKLTYTDINETLLIDESVKFVLDKAKEYKSTSIIKQVYNAQNDEIEQYQESLGEIQNTKLSKEKIKELILSFTKNKKLNLPVAFCAKIFKEILQRANNQSIEMALNTSNLTEEITKIINKNLLANVSYEFGADYKFSNDDLLFNNDGSPKTSIKKSALGKFIKADTTTSEKYLYDKIIYDSDIEAKTSKENTILNSKDYGEIKVFAKLPNFKIPTPVGDYFPDFAYVIKKDSDEQIFFVCETKGYNNENSFDDNAGKIEENKIKCAEKFFEALSKELKNTNIKVIYAKRLNKQNITDIIKTTINNK